MYLPYPTRGVYPAYSWVTIWLLHVITQLPAAHPSDSWLLQRTTDYWKHSVGHIASEHVVFENVWNKQHDFISPFYPLCIFLEWHFSLAWSSLDPINPPQSSPFFLVNFARFFWWMTRKPSGKPTLRYWTWPCLVRWFTMIYLFDPFRNGDFP